MIKPTAYKRVLFSRAIAATVVGVAAVVALFSWAFQPAQAATSSTLNFQARLLQSSGAVVSDGYYHVEFKIYNDATAAGTQDQGACTYNGGTSDAECLWFENYTGASTAARVRVVNGYLTVNLGANTAFGTNINWDQDLWLSMRIGGSSTSASWDAEMSPRLKLTAVPYAFRAGMLAKQTGANTSTLQFDTQTGARSILLPDASGTLPVATTTLTQYGVLYGTGAASLQSTGAGNTGECLLGNSGGAPTWGSCATGTVTLQSAYDASSGNSITTTDNRNIVFNLADTTTDSDFIVNLQGTDNTFEVQDGGSAFLTMSDSRNISYSAGTAGQLAVSGSLTGGRSAALVTVTQANDASGGAVNSAGLVVLTNSDADSVAPVLTVTQSASSANAVGISASAASSSGVAFQSTNTNGFGFAAAANTGGIGFSTGTNTTSGTGFNFSTTSRLLSSGSAINVGGTATGDGSGNSLVGYTGNLVNIAPIRTHIDATSITDSGKLLNIARANTVNNAGGALTVSGALVNLQSNCTATSGTCTDTANLLAINQQHANATGDVVTLQGAGTGNLVTLDASNSSANGVSVDIQSSSASQYALNITTNNGATNALTVRGDGRVGIGDTSPAYALTVGSGDLFGVNSSGNVIITALGTANTNTLLCRNSSNQVATCSGSLTGNAFIQGGNAFGTTAILGTTDAQDLSVRTNGNESFVVLANSDVNFNPSSNTLYVDAQNNRIGIGTASPQQKLEVAGGGARLRISSPNNSNDSVGMELYNQSTFRGGFLYNASTGNTDFYGPNGTEAITINASRQVAIPVLGSATNATYLCYNSSSQLASCNTTGAGAAFVQGGNSFGATATLGTNDANSLAFETGGTTRLTLDTSGNLAFAGSNSITSSATNGTLTLQSNAAGAITLDSGTTGAVNVGTGSNAKTVTVGNTTGATALSLQAGTGNFTLDGVGGTTYTMGASTVAGTFTIGGTGQTGTITLGRSTDTNTITIGSAVGNTKTQTINLGTSATAGSTTVVNIGSTVAGTTTVNGNAVLGTSSSNTLTVNSRIASSLVPNADDTYDLGSSMLRWRDLYLGGETIHIGTNSTDEATLGYDTATNELVFNEGAANTDVRMEGDTDANLFKLDAGNDRIGIGTGTPSAKFHVQGTAAATVVNVMQAAASQTADIQQILNNSNDVLGRIDAGGNIVAALDPPTTALTAAATGSGNLNGAYSYVVTYVTAQGETFAGPVSNTVTTSGGQQMNLTNIPTGPTGTKARNIYRTPRQVNGVTTNWRYVTQIADNTTTSTTDNVADTALTFSPPMPVLAPLMAPWASENGVDGTSGTLSGTYLYKATYITPWGETPASPANSSITVSSKAITLNDIPFGDTKNVTATRIYRTTNGGSTYYYNPTLRAYKSGSDISGGGTITDPSVKRRDDNTADGSLNTNILPPTDRNTSNRPSAPSVSLVGSSGNLTTGSRYVWAYSYVNSTGGESAVSPVSSQLTAGNGTNEQADIGIAAGPAGTVSRKVYRATVTSQSFNVGVTGFNTGDIYGPLQLVATVGDNSTTTYRDNTLDSALTVDRPDYTGFATAGIATNQIKVTAPQGTAPLIVTSTTTVKNLSAEMVGGNDQLGIKDFTWNIDEALKHFRTALANAHKQAVVVNVIGDSIMDGFGSSSRNATNVPSRLRKVLQDKYGNGGTGFQKGLHNVNWVQYLPGTNNPTYTAGLMGANGSSLTMCNSAAGGNQASVTLNFYGTDIDLQYTKGTSFATLKYNIDNGTAIGTVNENLTAFTPSSMGNRLTMATKLDPNVQHTVTISTNTTTSSECVSLEGIDATFSTGVRVNNVSTGGSQAKSYYTSDDAAIGSFSPTPDLVIMDWGTNEANLSTSPQEFKASYQKWLGQAKRASKPADCILITPPVQSVSPTFSQAAYRDIIYQLAEENNCGVLDMARKWNNSYSWAQERGLFSDGSGASGTDTLHPSDAGYADISSTLLEFLDRGVQINHKLSVDNNLSVNGGYFSLVSLSAPTGITQDTPSVTGSQTGTYRYAVTAMNDYGESMASAAYAFGPYNNAGVSAGTGSIVVRWDPVPGATKYRVYRCTTGGCGVGSTLPYYYDVYQSSINDDGSITWNRSENDLTIRAPGDNYNNTTFMGALLQGASKNALNVAQNTGDSVINIDTTVNQNNLILNSGFELGTSNLITKNPGFEGGDTTTNVGTIDAWTAKGTWGDAYRDNITRYEGSSSVRVVVWTPNDGIKYPIRLPAGTYEVSFWARTDTISGGTTINAGYSDNGSTETNCTANITAVTLSWQQFTCRFAANPSSDNAYLYIEQNGTNSLRNFYIDKISLEAMSTPTGWAARGSSTVSRTETQQYAGDASMHVTTTTTNDGAKYNISLSNTVSYSLSFMVRSSVAMTTLSAGYAADGSTESNCALSTTSVSASGWTRVTCTFTAGSPTGTPYVYIKQSDATGRTLYIDSIMLEASSTNSTFMGGGTIQLAGVITSPMVIQGPSDSTQAFTINNASGTAMFNVDTLNSKITMINNKVEIKDMSTNFGALASAGAFISNNSYYGEEFNNDKTIGTPTADTTALGDDGSWTADVTGSLLTLSSSGRVNGTLRAVSTATSTQGVLFAHGTAIGTTTKLFTYSNLPVMQVKFMTNNSVGTTNDYQIGMTDRTTAPASDNSLPADGAYFTNNNTGSWVGQVRSGSATVGTTSACGTISTTGFAVMRIEVLTATSARFLLDTDASDGISFVECGTVSGTAPSGSLGSTVSMWQQNTSQDPTIELDYVRVWQDDAPVTDPQQAGLTVQSSTGSTDNLQGEGDGDGTQAVLNDQTPEQPEQPATTGSQTQAATSAAGLSGATLNVSGNAQLGSLTVTGEARAQSLTVTGNAKLGSLQVSGLATLDKLEVETKAKIKVLVVTDIAEIGGDVKFTTLINTKQNAIIRKFTASQAIAPGSVVVLDPEHGGRVKLTAAAQDTKIIGVAVTEAKQAGDEIEVAVGGQVQVVVSSTMLTPGDLLVTDETAGKVRVEASPRTGAVLGKATSQKDTATNKAWMIITLQ